MDRSRWVSLGMVVAYVAVYVLALVVAGPGAGASRVEGFAAERAGFVLLFLGFACIWWSEALDSPLWMGQTAGKAMPSSHAVTLLGWLLMALAVAVPLAARLRRG